MVKLSPAKTAVVLFNLGGPDCLESVRPFLFNLFYDPAIIRLPTPLRYLIARLISWRRTHEAQGIYSLLGGKSPLLENTQAQAKALEKDLGDGYKVFIAMRYWHPQAAETIAEIQKWNPDEVVLLPLYPQFSTTTTESSIKDWYQVAQKSGFNKPTRQIACYPFHESFLRAYRDLILKALPASEKPPYRVLFTAHGLPQQIVDAGDPYAWQVEEGAKKLVALLNLPHLDWRVCYQSRVGPVEWIKPYTDQEIIQAAQEKLGIVLVPLSFVSEHSETLVELDLQYKALALEHGASFYQRVPTVSCHPDYIKCLVDVVKNGYISDNICPKNYKSCICRELKNA